MTKQQLATVILLLFMIVLLLLVILTSCAHVNSKKEAPAQYTIGFHNQSNETMVYHLYWLDNPGVDPVEVAAGELLPGQLNEINRMEGYYLIMWAELPSYDIVHAEPFRHFLDTIFVHK